MLTKQYKDSSYWQNDTYGNAPFLSPKQKPIETKTKLLEKKGCFRWPYWFYLSIKSSEMVVFIMTFLPPQLLQLFLCDSILSYSPSLGQCNKY
jgi:hypothetical protein